MKGNKHLFEIPNCSYSGSTDFGRNLHSVPVRRVFIRKGRRTNTGIEGISIGADKLTY